MSSATIRVSDLYDKIVDEFGIPAQVLKKDVESVKQHLSTLSREQLEKLELHVRRLHARNQQESLTPVVEILVLYPRGNMSLDVGSSTFLPVHFVDIKNF